MMCVSNGFLSFRFTSYCGRSTESKFGEKDKCASEVRITTAHAPRMPAVAAKDMGVDALDSVEFNVQARGFADRKSRMLARNSESNATTWTNLSPKTGKRSAACISSMGRCSWRRADARDR